jgi:hypothetical protein
VDFKIKALHNLDFKIRVLKVDYNSHNLKIGEVNHLDFLINAELQAAIISANLLLHHKILAISLNSEGKMILEVIKDQIRIVDNNHLLPSKDLAIEFLRKMRNNVQVQEKI